MDVMERLTELAQELADLLEAEVPDYLGVPLTEVVGMELAPGDEWLAPDQPADVEMRARRLLQVGFALERRSRELIRLAAPRQIGAPAGVASGPFPIVAPASSQPTVVAEG